MLPDSKIRSIYKELISGCLSLEEILKVAYLGPEGTHSEAAVYNQFGSQVKRIPALTIDDVLTKNDCKNAIHLFGENTFENDDNDEVEEGEGWMVEVIVMICTANCDSL